MSMFLTLAYLFFIGSVAGWVLELIYRNMRSNHQKWINPGFCTGPYVPLYGFGLCILYLLASIECFFKIKNPIISKVVIILIMSICMTLLEYIAGVFCLKFLKVRLWDYSNEWGNIQGIICPNFSLAWSVIAFIYDVVIHPRILYALQWLSENLAFSFFIGMFFGIFLIDVANSAQIVAKLKKYADENEVIVRYENIKYHIRDVHIRASKKYRFFFPFHSERALSDLLMEMHDTLEKQRKRRK